MSKIITTIIVLAIISVLIDIEARRRAPNIFIVKRLPFGYNASTIPGAGIFVTKEQAQNEELLKHEFRHWAQYRRMGLIPFLLDYALNALIFGYDKNKYEIEARTNENEYCKKNYTECVRNCESETICDLNFRR